MYPQWTGCLEASTTNPDVSNWNTGNVSTMRGMFLEALIATPNVNVVEHK